MPSICDGHELFDRFIAATFFNEDGGEYDFIIVGAGSAGSQALIEKSETWELVPVYIALAINDGFKTKQEKKPTHSQNIVHTH